MNRAVIFDLDGTLVDSAPDIHASANALLRAMGYQPIAYDLLCSFIGNGIPKLVERVMRASHIEVTEARHAELTARFSALYAEKPAEKTTLYPGVLALLDSLRDRGFGLGICTNKAHGLTLKVLDGMGLGDRFGSVIGGDSLPVKKPDPAPFFACRDALGADEVVYVGDSETDAATAQAAGVPFALFTEGYRKTSVALIPHQVAFSDYGKLAPLLDALLEKEGVA